MLNPVVFTERVVRDFLRYQLTTYPIADADLHAQLRALLNITESRHSPLMQGPYVSLSRPFREGPKISQLIAEKILHPLLTTVAPFPSVHGHQERAIRAIQQGRTTLVSTGTGSGKTEAFLYPIISRCLGLRDQHSPVGVIAVLVYPMNALAEDQLERLRGMLAGTGVTFGMYVGKTPERSADVQGKRLEPGSSRAAYDTAVRKRAEERAVGKTSKAGNYAVHPAEERCAREEMRASGQQPRILLTNVKQLELILTRHKDVELFQGANLQFIVFDEAHTFKGAQGAETACLIRRLRTFCGRRAEEVTCIAASATIVDAAGSDTPGREFAARFFGVDGSKAEIVTEQYVEEEWATAKSWPQALVMPGPAALAHVLKELGGDDADAIVGSIAAAVGLKLEASTDWQESLYTQLAANGLLHRIVQGLRRPKALELLCAELSKELGRTLNEAEVLLWLALGSAAKRAGRPLVRPVLHVFVRGIGGAVVTFPTAQERPKLWLSAEDKTRIEAEEHPDGQGHAAFPVKTCVTCGQHYFTHELAGFSFTDDEPGGGSLHGDVTAWSPLPRKDGGIRVTLFDRIVSEDAAEEEGSAERTAWVHLCRHCGTTHATQAPTCCGCGRSQSQIRLKAVRQNSKNPNYLTSCLACGSRGGNRTGAYREPARPVRATTVSDIHVLGQNMLLHGHEERLLIFADNRQDAAFQAGWMRDHARRFRIRSLMLEKLNQGPITIGDLAAWMDERLHADRALSEALVPEVWRIYRPEVAPQKHREELRYFLRILVLREITTGIRQRIGLEPWGRLRVDYRGLTPELPVIQKWAGVAGVSPTDLCNGIANLIDTGRRKMIVHDSVRQIFSKFWNPGDEEVLRGYIPDLQGVPQGLKLYREPLDEKTRVAQWWSVKGTTVAKQAALSWGIPKDQLLLFLEEVWSALKSSLHLLVEVQLRGGGKGGGRVLPGTQGCCQLDADKFVLVPQDARWECGVCRRVHNRPTPKMACMGYHCAGTILSKPLDADNYDLSIVAQQLNGDIRILKPREHSAQVPVEERESLERMFKDPKDKSVNTLICTPTLEMGVDIGGLDSVMMRNVPPLPANYWQRAGRAGRRNRMAVNLTYARTAPHDQAVFREPLRLLNGLVTPPRFNLRNPELVRKHAHATILTVLHRLAHQGAGLSTEQKAELSAGLNHLFPTQVRAYLFDAAGNVLLEATDVTDLAALLHMHRAPILETLAAAMSSTWPESDKAFVTGAVMDQILTEMPNRLTEVVRRLWKRLQWALNEKRRFAEMEAMKGTLENEDIAMRERSDRLIRRLKGEDKRDKRQSEGVDDTNTFAVLASEGFLPGYGLDRGSITGTAIMPKGLPGPSEYLLPRPSAMALREYVPGNMIYANGQKFVPRFFRLEAVDPTIIKLDLTKEAVATAESGATAAGGMTMPAIPICDVDLPHEWHIHDEEDHRFQMGVVVLGHELDRHSGGRAYRWGTTDMQFRRASHFRLVNVGANLLVRKDDPQLGYPVCLVSGISRSPLASPTELENFREHQREKHKKDPQNVAFYADIVADAFTLQDLPNLGVAYSVVEGLRLAAAQILEMEVEDLQILCIPHLDRDTVDAVLYDPMPGGSGLLEQMTERWPEVLGAAKALLQCVSECQTACLDCMLHFRNAHFHRHLDRRKALAFYNERQALQITHPIPAAQPASKVGKAEEPSHAPEFRLRDMLVRAGLGEPEAQKPIPIGQPWGRTLPDFFYQPPDDRHEGVCVYLDGLSKHIHGSAETQQRDTQIRERLGELGFEVISIPKSALDDHERMATYLIRIARKLLTKTEWERMAADRSWFAN
ncbi:MAG: DEAD/DEAH box helicase [Opitutus sp.]